MTTATKAEDAPVGVILVTHTDYGSSLLKAAEFILGPLVNCASVGVDGAQEVDSTVRTLREAVASLDKGAGVLVLTDMFGGTPTNLSLSLLAKGKLEVVTGVNLPMVLKVLTTRQLALDQLASEASQAWLPGYRGGWRAVCGARWKGTEPCSGYGWTIA